MKNIYLKLFLLFFYLNVFLHGDLIFTNQDVSYKTINGEDIKNKEENSIKKSKDIFIENTNNDKDIDIEVIDSFEEISIDSNINKEVDTLFTDKKNNTQENNKISVLKEQESNIKVLYHLSTSKLKDFEDEFLNSIIKTRKIFSEKKQKVQFIVLIDKPSMKFFLKDVKNTIFQDSKNLITINASIKKDLELLVKNGIVKLYLSESDLKRYKLEKSNVFNFINFIENKQFFIIEREIQNFIYIPII